MAIFGKKDKDKKETKAPAVAPAPGAGMVMPGTGGKNDKPGKKSKSRKLKANTGNAYRVLLRPIISEKGSFLAEENTYLFQVAKDASRRDVATAIKSVYGIIPERVRIMNVSGKSRRQRNVQGWTGDWKKAMVTLPAGKEIDLYQGV